MGRILYSSAISPAIPLALLIAMLSASAAHAQTTPPATAPSTQPAWTDRENALLHQMETGTWRQRQSAVNELINRGAWEVPAVNQMLAITKSPDAKARLRAVLRRLIHDRALGPSLITLHFKNAPAKTVYAELFRQAWAPLLTTPDNLLDDPALPKITINAQHKPFWMVMRELEQTTGLGLVSQIDGYRLRRGARLARGPVAISGPFLVVLTGLRPMMFDAQNYAVDFSIYAEPNLISAKERPIQSAGVTLNFLRCQKAGSVYQICFACQQDPLEQFQKINIEQPGWQLKVLDATGQILPPAETVITGDGNTNQMTMIYGPKLFGKPIPQPDRLIWNVPTEIQVVNLDLDFGDINVPLPGP